MTQPVLELKGLSKSFAATQARAAVNESTLPEQIFAPFADAIVAPSPSPADAAATGTLAELKSPAPRDKAEAAQAAPGALM